MEYLHLKVSNFCFSMLLNIFYSYDLVYFYYKSLRYYYNTASYVDIGKFKLDIHTGTKIFPLHSKLPFYT